MELGAMSSSVNKSYLMNNSNDIVEEVEEESGWTDYLDPCFDGGSFVSTPSLISDAAWNGSDYNNNNNNNNVIISTPPLRILNLKRNFKHRKYSYGDDDLEDTASSPVNSPKVSTMKQMEVNYRRLDDLAAAGNFLGKQVAGTSNFSEVVTGGTKNGKKNNNMGIGIESRNNNVDHKFVDDLRKRGLCLVPISALMNYLG